MKNIIHTIKCAILLVKSKDKSINLYKSIIFSREEPHLIEYISEVSTIDYIGLTALLGLRRKIKYDPVIYSLNKYMKTLDPESAFKLIHRVNAVTLVSYYSYAVDNNISIRKAWLNKKTCIKVFEKYKCHYSSIIDNPNKKPIIIGNIKIFGL